MASGLGPSLPLSLDRGDGIKMHKDIQALAKQNLKNLVLTNPGERVMISAFGVGLIRRLFEPMTESVLADVSESIFQQVYDYLPYLDIEDVSFDVRKADQNIIGVKIFYKIIPIGVTDNLTLSEEDLGII